jgi:membrane-associated phospholipid phosphatase
MKERTAFLISLIFHPLFLFIYGCLFIFHVVHQGQVSIPVLEKGFIAIIVLNTIFLPALGAKLFSNSILLGKRKERRIPYLITIFFYFISYLLMKNAGFPPEYLIFLTSIIFSLASIYFVNNRWKISMHTLGAGGFMALFTIYYQPNHLYLIFLFISLILSVTVAFARFKLKAHTVDQLIAGFFLGYICMYFMLKWEFYV